MPRVKRGIHHLKRRKNILKKVKGFHFARKNQIKLAQTAIRKAGQHAFADRRKKKGNMRKLWQMNISAAAIENSLSYSKLMGALRKAKIELDRKVLADLAINHPTIFKAIVAEVK